MTLKSIAAAKAAEAEAAARTAEEARSAAARLATESARLAKAQRLAEGAKNRAEAMLKGAEDALASANSDANPSRPRSSAPRKPRPRRRPRSTEAQAQLDAAKAAAEPKMEGLMRAREEAKDGRGCQGRGRRRRPRRPAAKMSPVSVFISRQTQRLYVRQAFQPIFDTAHHDQGCGQADRHAHLYRARYVKDGADVRWSAVSMTSSQGAREPAARRTV